MVWVFGFLLFVLLCVLQLVLNLVLFLLFFLVLWVLDLLLALVFALALQSVHLSFHFRLFLQDRLFPSFLDHLWLGPLLCRGYRNEFVLGLELWYHRFQGMGRVM